uniref:ribonuclease H n=1 Tax=Oryzias latipes TaxID=8090 RepID=A0A3B3H959_ORYLA
MSLEPDIISLNETHLSNLIPELDGFTWIGHNRIVHRKAVKASGGVGLFVKNTLLDSFSLRIDKTYDGILSLRFEHGLSQFSFIVISCYLSPETSTWGRNADLFFAHLLSLIYASDADSVYICGDLNSRIGCLKDFVDEDDIPSRVVLDTVLNNHGHTFVEFLKDSKCCVLNGRVNPENDCFTSVSFKGKAVVDYIVTPHTGLNECVEFKVLTPLELIKSNKSDLMNLIDDRSKLPDHSVLYLRFKTIETNFSNNMQAGLQNKKPIRKLPVHFLESEVCCESLCEIGLQLREGKQTQENLNHCYGWFCNVLFKELDKNRPKQKYKSNKGICKRNQPYWNNELQSLWEKLCLSEKKYLKCKEMVLKRELLSVFKNCQSHFDKKLKLFKRRFRRGKALQLQLHLQNNKSQLFWREINKLGPKSRRPIPHEILTDSGESVFLTEQVLNKWESDYKNLFTCNSSSHLFDDQFFLNMCKSKKLLEDNKISLNYSDKINQDITIEEVLKVIEKTKLHKAAGVDELSNEVLKCPKLLTTLHCLFRFCFKNGFIPSIWYKSIIKPIPKSPQADPRVPLNYRGISLLSTVYKVFSSILNNRLSEYLETNEVLVEEQNGFRRNRACIDNIYVLSSVVRARLQESKSTFVCFVDFKKAFDSIDRDLLQYKLLTYGINGQFYKAIKALYKAPLACVQVNDLKTGWFSTPFGVKQGDVLSPTLFSIYVNDLAQEIKKTNLGIDINNWNLSILLYADDIILIADEEIKLQGMLNTMNDWCNKWRLTINSDKTQIVHFRKPLVPQSNFLFYFGKTTLMYTDTYKYLGFVFHKNMMFSEGKQRLSDSAGRALGAVINKMKVCPELSLDTFSKLYDAMVGSVLFYSAGVWGYEDAPECDKVQYRAMRYFLGVHRFTTKAAVEGDMGWEPCVIKQRAEVLRLWNRLVTLPVERIARKIFDWDRAHMYPWCNDVFNILSSVNLQSLFFNCLKCKIDNVKETLVGYYEKDWKMKLLQKPKLRTYLQIKDTFSAESYVIYNLKRGQRSLCAQLRAGVLPLQVEVGRFKGIPEEERLCEVCELRVVEDEFHFLFYCPLYEKQRLCMYDVIEKKCPDLFWLSEDKILRWLFENEIFCLANFVSKAWIIRMDSMYSVRL